MVQQPSTSRTRTTQTGTTSSKCEQYFQQEVCSIERDEGERSTGAKVEASVFCSFFFPVFFSVCVYPFLLLGPVFFSFTFCWLSFFAALVFPSVMSFPTLCAQRSFFLFAFSVCASDSLPLRWLVCVCCLFFSVHRLLIFLPFLRLLYMIALPCVRVHST